MANSVAPDQAASDRSWLIRIYTVFKVIQNSFDFYRAVIKDIENRSLRAHHTKEYSLFQKIGIPARTMGIQDCKSALSESSVIFYKCIAHNANTPRL